MGSLGIFAAVAVREGGADDQAGPLIVEALVDASYPVPLSRSEVDDAVGSLIGAGLIAGSRIMPKPDRCGPRPLEADCPRMKEAGMQKRLASVIGSNSSGASPSGWACPDGTWAEAERLTRFGRLERVRARLEILEGLIQAIDQWDLLSGLVASAADRHAAVEALRQSPLGMTEVQAHHVLDMRVTSRTIAGRAGIKKRHKLCGAKPHNSIPEGWTPDRRLGRDR